MQRAQQELLVTDLVRTSLRKAQPQAVKGEAPQHQEEAQRLAHKAMTQLQLGAVGKAARTLAAPPTSVAQSTPQLIQHLNVLFPTSVLPTSSRQPAVILRLDTALIKESVMKRMSRAAAPGPDGWTRELLLPLVMHKDCLTELTELMRRMLSNDCSLHFKARVLAANICPLTKPDGGIRPICPESALTKLASIVAMRLLTHSEVEQCVSKHQFGVGGSAVAAVKMCRSHLQMRLHWTQKMLSIAFHALQSCEKFSRTLPSAQYAASWSSR